MLVIGGSLFHISFIVLWQTYFFGEKITIYFIYTFYIYTIVVVPCRRPGHSDWDAMMNEISMNILTGIVNPLDFETIRLVMSTIPKWKYKRSNIEAYYRNETKNVLMCSKKWSRTFLFIPKTWKRNNNVFMCTRTC